MGLIQSMSQLSFYSTPPSTSTASAGGAMAPATGTEVQPWSKRASSAESDALLVHEIKELCQFPTAFWDMLKGSTTACVCGSSPVAVAHGLAQNADWKDGDIDLFVSSAHPTDSVNSVASTSVAQTSAVDQKDVKTTGVDQKDVKTAAGDQKSKVGFRKEQVSKVSVEIMGRFWVALGLQDVKVADVKTRYNKYVAFGTSFLASEKRIHPVTKKTINVVVVDTGGCSIQEYVTKTFDFTILSLSTDGTTCQIPDRDHLRQLKSRQGPKGHHAQLRTKKYAKRGLVIV